MYWIFVSILILLVCIEKNYWIKDRLVDERMEEIVIHLGAESDSGSETELDTTDDEEA